MGYGPWGRKELDTTEATYSPHTALFPFFFLSVKVIIEFNIENLENVMKYREEMKNENPTTEGTTIHIPSALCFPSFTS